MVLLPLNQISLSLLKLILPADMEGYRAFDEYEGIEVAWNQVKLYDFLRSPEDLERLYCEIHLLKILKHRNIMKYYTSWVDSANRNINFVTEMFTSGTLRQYRLKHKKVDIRAVKHWCRQILNGLLYLHSHNPPVIHRDLKCDNIFINVKIGDLGLAAILRKSQAARCVGTPEFMAPEVYEEEYNELVDIYSFGMCILEMVTFEYPYSECIHPAQIYKKVISGKKPEALYKVKDPEVRQFVEKCLVTASQRLPAGELLKDPFLEIDDNIYDLRPIEYFQDFREIGSILRQPLSVMDHSTISSVNGYSNDGYFNNYLGYEPWSGLDFHCSEFELNEINLFTSHEDEYLGSVDITIKGRRKEDDGIFLRLRIADKEGLIRNIYFPFDIETDTAFSVATEMVAELDIADQDVTKIADMIDGEIASLVPGWKRGFKLDESPHYSDNKYCLNCCSKGSFMDYIFPNNPSGKSLQVLQCSERGCAAVHGRFEEISYQFEGSEQCVNEGAPAASSQSDGLCYTDVWAQHGGPELSSQGSTVQPSHCEDEEFRESTSGKVDKIINVDKENSSEVRHSHYENTSSTRDVADDYENEIRQEMRWLKAKYQMQLRQLKDQQLRFMSQSTSSRDADDKEQKKDQLPYTPNPLIEEKDKHLLKSVASEKQFNSYFPIDAEKECANKRIQNYEAAYGSCSPVHMVTAKSYYTDSLLQHTLHRATSLPVDAVDF